MSNRIPFLPLDQINAPFRGEIDRAFRGILDRGWYLLGEELRSFEKEWAAYCGTTHCIGVGSGLDALQLILEAWKIEGRLQPGDEVLVPAQTFFATFLAVSRAGLTPVPVDVHPTTCLMNPAGLEAAMSDRTRVLMPVHLYGFLCSMTEIGDFAKRHNLLVLEDAAQAHGASDHRGIRAGAFGDAAAFSFYPGKNLGCMGDGGAIVTSDAKTAEITRMLRNYGMSKKYHHDLPGFNSRLDEFQAAVLRIKLRSLDQIREKRARLAEVYLRELAGTSLGLPEPPTGQVPAWHLFVVRTKSRDEVLQRLLAEHQIEALIHYPIVPADQQGCLPIRERDCPQAKQFAAECLSLPLHELLNDDDIVRIATALKACVSAID